MPSRSKTSPTKTRSGGSSPRRRKDNDMTARAAESNGGDGGSDPPPARAQGGRNFGPMTQSDGITRGTKGKAGSSRPSKPSLRRKSRTVESRASMPDLGSFEAQIEESHNQFLASFSSRLRHALRMGQLLLQVKERLGRSPFTDWVESRYPYSVASARRYMRVARNVAVVDEVSKRQFATGLTLTDVLKRLAKPRAKKTASEGGGADTSTKSALPEPDEHAQVDAGGPNEDTGEATADAEAESARDDGEATAQDPDAATVAEEQLDDEQWLANRPVRQKLADTTLFDSEALLWRRTWPEVARMIQRLKAHIPELCEAVAKGEPLYYQYARQLTDMVLFRHPDSWYVCSYCKGKGRKGREKEPCFICGGGGFSTGKGPSDGR